MTMTRIAPPYYIQHISGIQTTSGTNPEIIYQLTPPSGYTKAAAAYCSGQKNNHFFCYDCYVDSTNKLHAQFHGDESQAGQFTAAFTIFWV